MSLELKHVAGSKWEVLNPDGEVVKTFTGPKKRVEPEFKEWLKTDEAQEITEAASFKEADENDPVSAAEDEEKRAASGEHGKTPTLPDASKLRGLAKTAALNAQVDSTVVESEWNQKSGVVNESNRVFNVPDGWRVAWATPRRIDGGRHANYLRADMGFRPVYKDEMANDMYEGEGMYTAFVDDDSSEFVFKDGAQLFIGNEERVAKIRKRDYDARMAAFNRKQDSIEHDAQRQGAMMRTTRNESDYNPMRR